MKLRQILKQKLRVEREAEALGAGEEYRYRWGGISLLKAHPVRAKAQAVRPHQKNSSGSIRSVVTEKLGVRSTGRTWYLLKMVD